MTLASHTPLVTIGIERAALTVFIKASGHVFL